ncbi:hypothetical protein OHC33_001470 [Knufia fluminis]|uniref:Protein arginine methyltransferase NDUFAF7 n=1 Tax=Knufia fluminis TaxID=191047 RepID=A0AAN8FEU2_9EURO|nr:hypothetical protein OHC33_001470 [Knufia fluminis]
MRNGTTVAGRCQPLLKTTRLPRLQPVILRPHRWQSTQATPPSPAIPPRRWSTPLAETIAKAIGVTGPISIASYMRQCLTNPDGGYYTTTRPTTDQFGRHGDFITSPEISQVFGELVGVWFLTEWMGQGRPATGVQFMEVGPGRGTMMSDILRAAAQFRSFSNAIEAVWLVEAGEGLRRQQCDLLCGEGVEMKEVQEKGHTVHWEAKSKHGNGIPIRWVEDVALLPTNTEKGKMPFIIAHEFFDALPIHAFESVAAAPEPQKTELLDKDGRPMVRQNPASKVPQWRELLVSPTRPKIDLFAPVKEGGVEQKQSDADFHLTIAKASNPNSIVIPERPRYRKLKQQPESRIEVSPESYRYVQDFAKRVGGNLSGDKPAGAALIIDYGPLENVPVNSFRGIREHKVISPFSFAGQADISADVDFGALADAALEGSEGVEVHGPVEQGSWLTQLGVKDRAERLMKNVEESKKDDIQTGWKRLVEGGPTGMGKAYKVMCIVPENGGKRRPVGFGGMVAS